MAGDQKTAYGTWSEAVLPTRDVPEVDYSSAGAWKRPLRRTVVALMAFGAMTALVAVASSSVGGRVSESSESSAMLSERPEGLELSSETSETSTTPNIILYTIDDMGWNDIGYNSMDLPHATDFMNSMAEDGIVLTHYYTQPSCTPSRSTIMSGKFVHKTGYQNLEIQHNYPLGMPISFKLLPEHMKGLDYRTYGYGKWNIGHCNEQYMPHWRGFEKFLGYNCPGHGYRDFNCGMDAGVRDMVEAWQSENSSTGEVTYHWRLAKELLGIYDTELYRNTLNEDLRSHHENHPHQPFFMWIAHHGVHGTEDSEPQPPDTLLTLENKEYLESLDVFDVHNSTFWKKRKITATLLMSVDNALRDTVHVLTELGILDNTVIVVHSDNGGDPNYMQGHPGNNAPLRGEKFFYLEGGIRVPAFVYAPGIIPKDLWGTEYTHMLHHVDLLTTFVALGGGDALAEDPTLDGINFWPSLLGDSSAENRDEIVFCLPRSGTSWQLDQNATEEAAVLRWGHYKIAITSVYDQVFYPTGGSSGFKNTMCSYEWYTVSSDNSKACDWDNWLFNIEDDPFEKVNLWDNDGYKEVKERMIKRVIELLEENPTPQYGRLMYEYYNKYYTDDEDATYYEVVKDRDYWLGPWDCDVIP